MTACAGASGENRGLGHENSLDFPSNKTVSLQHDIFRPVGASILHGAGMHCPWEQESGHCGNHRITGHPILTLTIATTVP